MGGLSGLELDELARNIDVLKDGRKIRGEALRKLRLSRRNDNRKQSALTEAEHEPGVPYVEHIGVPVPKDPSRGERIVGKGNSQTFC
jgi:hypothetical protein